LCIAFGFLSFHVMSGCQLLHRHLKFPKDEVGDQAVFGQFLIGFVVELGLVVFGFDARLLCLLIEKIVLQSGAKVCQIGLSASQLQFGIGGPLLHVGIAHNEDNRVRFNDVAC